MTNEVRETKWLLLLPVAALAALLFVGAGCASESVTDVGDTDTTVVEKTGLAGDFSGLEGSLTEQGMDTMAEAYSAFLRENNLVPESEGFDMYRLSSRAGSLPINDAYTNSLELEVVDGGYMLWSEGEDKKPDTADDYYKVYSF